MRATYLLVSFIFPVLFYHTFSPMFIFRAYFLYLLLFFSFTLLLNYFECPCFIILLSLQFYYVILLKVIQIFTTIKIDVASSGSRCYSNIDNAESSFLAWMFFAGILSSAANGKSTVLVGHYIGLLACSTRGFVHGALQVIGMICFTR